jgi:hypothetical protein
MYNSSPLTSKPYDPGNSNASGSYNASAVPPLCPRSVWSGVAHRVAQHGPGPLRDIYLPHKAPQHCPGPLCDVNEPHRAPQHGPGPLHDPSIARDSGKTIHV